MNQMAEGLRFCRTGNDSRSEAVCKNAMQVDEDAFAEAFQMNMTGEKTGRTDDVYGAAEKCDV